MKQMRAIHAIHTRAGKKPVVHNPGTVFSPNSPEEAEDLIARKAAVWTEPEAKKAPAKPAADKKAAKADAAAAAKADEDEDDDAGDDAGEDMLG